MDATSRARVVVVDDEPLLLEAWKEVLAAKFDLRLFADPLAAARSFATEDVDVALLDMRMPGMDGLALLERLRQEQPNAEAIIVTGHGTIQTAVQAVQMGAYDFLCKPIDDLDGAVRRIEGALERKRLRRVNEGLRASLDAYLPGSDLIGDSRGIRKVRELIAQIADSPPPVMICGESGTGKELAARALHQKSGRHDKPFLTVNCAALPPTLIDSELFGHERGAFTGAVAAHRGLFEAADGGTLFLDEIGDMPASTQVHLLRALQDGEIRAVGATRSRSVDVRVIAATNINLERAIRDGKFREDFYYRISTFRIDLPALRDRREDIPPIAAHLLAKYAARAGRTAPGFADTALQALVQYDWPGNVRELNNAIEHAATLCGASTIELCHLPSFVVAQTSGRAKNTLSQVFGTASAQAFATARDQVLEEFEQRYLSDLLAVTGGNLSEAARRSGIDRSNLRRLLRKYNITAASFKQPD
ncbi:MAG: sigma-54-dependent Fis family transcriptional regulator [Deltaproteobacteria bacterium]|nr:sigma-54-dependent Fis family transcriptional regulator [Deltaproteobacteria bacterium]